MESISSNYYPTMLGNLAKQFKIPMNIPIQRNWHSRKRTWCCTVQEMRPSSSIWRWIGGVRSVEILLIGRERAGAVTQMKRIVILRH